MKNGKWKVVKTNLHMWFNKVCVELKISALHLHFLNMKNAVHGTVRFIVLLVFRQTRRAWNEWYIPVYGYSADINILGRSVHAVKGNTDALVVTRKEAGLEVNTDKTNYVVMSRCQNAGHNHNIQIGNKSFERVEGFKYWEQL